MSTSSIATRTTTIVRARQELSPVELYIRAIHHAEEVRRAARERIDAAFYERVEHARALYVGQPAPMNGTVVPPPAA